MEGESPIQASTPGGAVFLSYASQDAEAARRICEALRAGGIEVWFDQSELRGGDAWDRQIRKQIHDCALFIPVISAHSDARHEGYFRREWRLAVERAGDMAEDTPFLLPVVIDSTPDATARVPDRFRDVQWSRLTDGQAPTAFIEHVQRLLAPEPSHGPTGGERSTRLASITAPKAPVTQHAWWSKPALLVLALLFIAGAGVYLALDRSGLSKRSAPAATAVGDKSIAVLPFVDLSEKHDQEYFADGMTEEVIDLLAKLPDLRIVGRTSSFQFREKATDVRSIGAALNVAYILEGSVRRSGDQIRVTAQLLSAADGTHRWSDTYEAKSDDAFKVQDSIAADLARTLQVAVTAVPRDDPLASSPAAYDLFLKGMQAFDSSSEEGTNRALASFAEVVRLEPRSARAHAALAMAYSSLGQEGWMAPTEAFGTGRQIALKALALDRQNALAHSVLATIAAEFDWNWTEANREVATALLLSGRDSGTLVAAAQIASAEEHWDQAHQYLNEAIAKDPLSADGFIALGAWVHLRTGRYEDAESALRRGLQIRPHWGTGRYYLATCLLMQGRLSEALVEAQREMPRDGRYQASSAIFFAMQRQKDSDDALRQALAESESDWPSSIAKLYAFRNERDKALEWLERAYGFRDEDLYWIKGDPLLKNLEGDPRYKAFLRKMNLPE